MQERHRDSKKRARIAAGSSNYTRAIETAQKSPILEGRGLEAARHWQMDLRGALSCLPVHLGQSDVYGAKNDDRVGDFHPPTHLSKAS
jgi:hypothetical protein